MRFQFIVHEVQKGTIEIGAESYEAALEEVDQAYFEGCVVWDDAEVQITFDKSWEDK